MEELINKYRERMGWNEHSIIAILMEYIEYAEKPGHKCMPFRDYIEQRALYEERDSDG